MTPEDRLTQHLKSFQKPPREAFKQQLREQLAQIEREQDEFYRSNHTHIQEKRDMTTIPFPQEFYPPDARGSSRLASILLNGMIAVLMAAFVFMLAVNSPLIKDNNFFGMFQDEEEYQKDRVELYINQAWNTGDTEILNELLSEDHTTTTTIFGTVEGADGVAGLIESYRTALPDFTYRIDHIDSFDNGQVWLHGTISGTHTGTFTLPDGTEIPPSGNRVTISSVIEFTFTDGKISAIHQIDNTQDLMEQLGGGQPVEEVANEVRNTRNMLLRTWWIYGELPENVTLKELQDSHGSFIEHYRHGPQTLRPGIPTALGSPIGVYLIDDGFTLHRVTATGDFVVAEYEFRSLYQGSNTTVGGVIPPKDELIPTNEIYIGRLENGKIVETWHYADDPLDAPCDYGFGEC